MVAIDAAKHHNSHQQFEPRVQAAQPWEGDALNDTTKTLVIVEE